MAAPMGEFRGTRGRRIVALALAASAWIAAAQGQESARGLAEILPPDTLLYLQTPDRQEQWKGYERSALYKISQQPDMAAFLKDLDDQHERFVQLAAERGKLDPAYVRALFNGRFGAALLDLRAVRDIGVLSTYVIAIELEQSLDESVIFGAIGAVWQDFLKAKQASGEIPEEALGLKRITWMESPIGRHKVLMAMSAPPQPPYRFVLLDRMLLCYRGDKRDALDTMVRNYDEAAPDSLARNPLYRHVRTGVEIDEGMGFLYANTGRLYTLLNGLGVPRVTTLLNALGIDGVRALGCASGFSRDADGYQEGIRQTLFLYAPGERRGILRTISFVKNPKAEMAAMVLPGDAPGILAARVDLASLYREVPRLVDAVDRALGSQTPMGLVQLAGQQTLCGVPAETVLATLGDALLIQPGPAGTALRFDNANGANFQAIVQHMEKSLGARFTPRKVGENTIHYMNRTATAMPLAPSYAVINPKPDGRAVVYLASHPQVIEAILEDPAAATLHDAPDYRRVMKGMGSGYGGFLYVDNREGYRRVYDALLPLLNVWTAAPLFAADPGKLPYGRQIEQHFFGCGVGVKNAPEGITFTAYSPIGLGGWWVHVIDKLIVSNPAALGVVAAEAGRWFSLRGDEESEAVTPPGMPASPGTPRHDGGVPGIGE